MKCLTFVSLLTAVTAVPLAPEVEGKARMKRTTDVSDLETLVQQQAALIQSLQTDLTATRNSVLTLHTVFHSQETSLTQVQNQLHLLQHQLHTQQDALSQVQNGQTSSVSQAAVAFSARLSPDGQLDGVPLGYHQTVVFDHVVTNIGSAYNSTTGVFTAPASGVYVFLLNIMSTNNHEGVYLVIARNGAVLHKVFAEGRNDIFDQGSSHVTTHLAAGDAILVRQETGDAIRGNYWTTFTGFLLQAD